MVTNWIKKYAEKTHQREVQENCANIRLTDKEKNIEYFREHEDDQDKIYIHKRDAVLYFSYK